MIKKSQHKQIGSLYRDGGSMNETNYLYYRNTIMLYLICKNKNGLYGLKLEPDLNIPVSVLFDPGFVPVHTPTIAMA